MADVAVTAIGSGSPVRSGWYTAAELAVPLSIARLCSFIATTTVMCMPAEFFVRRIVCAGKGRFSSSHLRQHMPKARSTHERSCAWSSLYASSGAFASKEPGQGVASVCEQAYASSPMRCRPLASS